MTGNAGSLEWSDPDGTQTHPIASFEIWRVPLLNREKILVELELADGTSVRVRLNLTDVQMREGLMVGDG